MSASHLTMAADEPCLASAVQVQDQPPNHASAPPTSLPRPREPTEREVIQQPLQITCNSRSRAADALGISRVTLYKKMKKYGLES
jgi:DNA-binding NtrC family response regulator